MYKSVIVGCGAISSNHAESILNTKNILIAACDTDKNALDKFCQKYNCKGYTDFDEMLSSEFFDAVHICTPHYLHFEMTLKALEKGKAVFLEKPPVVCKNQLEQLKKMSHNKNLTICFQNRFNTSTEMVKEMIQSEEYGKLLGANASVTWNRENEYYTNSTWRGKKPKECGGVLINQAIHTLDLLCYLIGTPTKVNSITSNLTHPYIEVEDTVAAIIEFGDKRASFFATTSACSSPPATITLCFEKAQVMFDSKSVSVRQKNSKTMDIDVVALGKECWGSSHNKLIDEFYKGLDKGYNPCSITECENTMNVMFDIYGKENI